MIHTDPTNLCKCASLSLSLSLSLFPPPPPPPPGPFWCAQDDVEIALSSCMKKPADISVTELVSITYSTSITGTIDLPHNLKGDRIYLFSGTRDTVVDQGQMMSTESTRALNRTCVYIVGVMKKAEEYYKSFVLSDNIITKFEIPAEHSMVSS